MRAFISIAAGTFAGYMAASALDGTSLTAQCLASFLVSIVTTWGVLEVLS